MPDTEAIRDADPSYAQDRVVVYPSESSKTTDSADCPASLQSLVTLRAERISRSMLIRAKSPFCLTLLIIPTLVFVLVVVDNTCVITTPSMAIILVVIITSMSVNPPVFIVFINLLTAIESVSSRQ